MGGLHFVLFCCRQPEFRRARHKLSFLIDQATFVVRLGERIAINEMGLVMSKGATGLQDEQRKPNELLLLLTSWESLTVFLSSIAIPFVAPDDVLTRHAILAQFVDHMSMWFPAIKSHQALSQFPQVAGLYYSTMHLLTPLFVIYSYRMRIFYHSRMARQPVKSYFAAFLLTIISFGGLYITFFSSTPVQFESMPVADSKLNLALTGWVFGGGAWWWTIGTTLITFILIFKQIGVKKCQ
ncbi:hypothetical protein C9I57_17530 [Trinickia symbiotica]|uniref:Uncharacterized protein n=1 Tax=Trinickia symbiotica TaxID=863227 RepID=A0A2T3XSJ9_9BURK|nr:hypothetical protein C9I57_17530 [Trinickia symbiotica]